MRRWQPATEAVERAAQPRVELTARKRAILIFVARHAPTTIRDIGVAVGLSSSSTTWTHIRELKRAGILKAVPGLNRTIALADGIVISLRGDVYRIVSQDPNSFAWRPE